MATGSEGKTILICVSNFNLFSRLFQIASRFLHSQPAGPKIVLKFHLDRENSLNHRQILADDTQEESRKELVVQSNANNLLHIIDQLESARTAVSLRKGI